MNKKCYCFIIIVILLLNSSLFAIGVTFTFSNGQITGTSPKYYEFDIMIAGASTGTKFGEASIYINYNTLAFGSAISANGKVSTSLGSLISNGLIYGVTHNDNTSSRLAITIQYKQAGDPSYGSDLPSSANQLVHVSIQISDQGQNAGLSFQPDVPIIARESDLSTNYSPITASDTDDSSLPVQMSNMQAESTIEGVELNWSTASEVNSRGFYVWRASDAQGEYEKITTSLITSEGNNSAGSQYRFLDQQIQFNGTYYYQIEQIDMNGGREMFGPIEVKAVFIPKEFGLSQNYPNPFNPTTTFNYDVPEISDVKICVYSLLGKEVKVLFSKQQTPGRFPVTWDGTDQTGQKLASGVYFLRMQAGSYTQMRKMTLIR